MHFPEFLELLVRIANACFKNCEEESLPLHLKVDLLLSILAHVIRESKEEFLDDPLYYEDEGADSSFTSGVM